MEEKKVSFEEKLEELEQIVKSLESGEILLDDAIDKYNEAMKIASECNKTLEEAEKAITKVVNKDGTEEKFDIE